MRGSAYEDQNVKYKNRKNKIDKRIKINFTMDFFDLWQ